MKAAILEMTKKAQNFVPKIDQSEAIESILGLNEDKCFSKFKTSELFEGVLRDFGNFANTMAYFSIYSLSELEDLVFLLV